MYSFYDIYISVPELVQLEDHQSFSDCVSVYFSVCVPVHISVCVGSY